MPPRGKNAPSSKPGAESEPQKRERAARGGEGRKRKRCCTSTNTSTSGVDSVDTRGTGYESEDAENAAELESEDATLDADDSFVVTSGQGGSAGAGSAAAHDDSDADEDEQPDGVEVNSAQTTKQRATFPYSELAKDKRLLHVTFDIEFSHSTKVLGEIFELSARPWRVEVVTGQGEQDEWQDLDAPRFEQLICPSLEYGDAEFAEMTIEVSALSSGWAGHIEERG
jgi:hypothetical protein